MVDEKNGVQAYELSCTDCTFTSTFEGDIEELFDVIEAHQEQMKTSPADHFVNFEATASSDAVAADD